jgi:hypothetical protein
MLTGFAIVSKISYIPILLPGIFILLIWNKYSDKQPAELLNRILSKELCAAIFIVTAFIILTILPQLVKNHILFNEPFAPFLFLHKTVINSVLNQSWYTTEATKFILLTYPIALTYGEYPMIGGNISPLILTFFPLLILLKRPFRILDSNTFKITIVAFVGVITWMIIRPSVLCPRYILPCLLLFIPICAKSVETVFRNLTGLLFLKSMIYIVVSLSLLASVFTYATSSYSDIKQAKSLKTNSVAISPYYAAENYLSQQADMGDRILIDGYFTFYLRPDLLQCINDSEGVDGQWQSLNNSEQKWEYLFRRGFSYILVQKSVSLLIKTLELQRTPEWMRIDIAYEDSNSVIYRIRSVDTNIHSDYACKQVFPPAWDVVQNK